MTYSMGYLRQFCRSFQQNAAATRIFFPDKKVSAAAETAQHAGRCICSEPCIYRPVVTVVFWSMHIRPDVKAWATLAH